MGQGGFITLVNATNTDWNLTHQHSYQMNAWTFPATIAARSSQRVYVEWDQGIFHNQRDDAGEAVYTLKGTNNQFQVQARAANGFTLQINYLNLESSGTPKGSVLNLGWQHDGIVNFVLAGGANGYTGTNLKSASWMKDNAGLIGGLPLKKICMTGSHDAGMSVYTSGTAFAHDCNTLTQSTSIQGQLNLGMRYFDIRPVISGGNYYTGHYGYIDQISSWQGANGQSIDSIIADVNAFTASQRELVVLNLSHSLNTDVGNSSYRPFNKDEWNGLFAKLNGIQQRYVSADPSVDLTAKRLNDFISTGSSVLLIVEDAGVDLGSYAGKGFYPYASFNAYNSYANTNDLGTMVNDQIGKMKQQSGKSYFLLSWTLTQNSTQASTCVLGTASSIKDLANQADQNLPYHLYPALAPAAFPNIIYVDNVTDTTVAAVAMAVNYTVLT